MADTNRIGASLGQIKQTLGLDGIGTRAGQPASGRAASVAGPGGGATIRGKILSPDQPVENLDRDVPRGTYIDILV